MPKGRWDFKKFRQFIHEYYRVKFLSFEYKKKESTNISVIMDLTRIQNTDDGGTPMKNIIAYSMEKLYKDLEEADERSNLKVDF